MVTRSDFNKYILPVYNPAKFIPKKAKGSYVWDQNNNKYLDFASGIAVSNLGHCHPTLVKTLNAQSKNLWHLSNVLANEPALKLAKLICNKTFAEKIFFTNSGAEAVEGAVKTARKYASTNFSNKKNEIVAFNDAFHGRTMMAIALNGSKRMTEGFGPMPGGIKQHPFNQVDGLKKIINKNTAAVVIELIQGEAGIVPAKKVFINEIKKLCRKNNALIVIDEVQSGVGRTGHLYAYEKYNIKPDILCSAKGMGNGIPIGAILTTNKVAKAMQVGAHGSTYGGNPLACSVSYEVFKEVSKKSFLNSVIKKEKLFLSLLNDLNKKYNCFTAVRSAGLWIGLELNSKIENLTLQNIMSSAYDEGLMILKANNNTLRLAPALTISEKEIKLGVKKLENSLSRLL